MARDAATAEFDIDCLRHVVADAEAQRTSLAAAMIKMHALAIARASPTARAQAMQIVRHVEQLYPGLPDRAALKEIIRGHLSPVGARAGEPPHVDRLAEAVWDHFRRGQE